MNNDALVVREKRKTRGFLREKFSDICADKAREFLREKFPDIPEDADPLIEAAEVISASIVLLGGMAATYVLFAITLP